MQCDCGRLVTCRTRDHKEGSRGLQEPIQGPTLRSRDPNVNDNRGTLMPVTSGVPGSAKVVEPHGELKLNTLYN